MPTISDALEALDGRMSEFAVGLCESDEKITSLICATNATSWGLDDAEIVMVEQQSPSEFKFRAALQLAGEQLEDKPVCGDVINVTVDGHLLIDEHGAYSIDDYSLSDVRLNF